MPNTPLVKGKNLSFLGIVKTKKAKLDKNHIAKLWENINFKYSSVDTVNSGDGLLCMSNERFYGTGGGDKGTKMDMR